MLLLHCRHTELFRSCKRASDKNAKSYMLEWTKGYIQIPNTDIKIPIMDIKKCLPETWKVSAVFLAVMLARIFVFVGAIVFAHFLIPLFSDLCNVFISFLDYNVLSS